VHIRTDGKYQKRKPAPIMALMPEREKLRDNCRTPISTIRTISRNYENPSAHTLHPATRKQ